MAAVSMMGPAECRLKDVRQDTALIMETINRHEPMAKHSCGTGVQKSLLATQQSSSEEGKLDMQN